ncbi:hypothetical protein [Dyella japonica]|nr:hypothetical protein [Dyella japonica]
MSWPSRPDDDALLFRYRSHGFFVRAAMQSTVAIAAPSDAQKGTLALAEMYATLRAVRSATADFLVSSLRQGHSPDGWPG